MESRAGREGRKRWVEKEVKRHWMEKKLEGKERKGENDREGKISCE